MTVDIKQNAILTKKRWIILIACCLINLCIGSLYAWSVFAGPMAAHLSEISGTEMTAASLAIVFSIGNGDGFITMIAGGAINQKLGPKLVVLIGGIVFALGFIICGLATNVGMLIAGYGICAGLSMGLIYGVTVSTSVKFFPDKAGLVGGIATASYGISSVIVPIVANVLIESVGVCNSFLVLGIISGVIIVACSLVIKPCPYGFVPSGWTPPIKEASLTVEDRNWHQMLSTPIFYVMIVMLFFGAVFGMMSISQASNVAQVMVGLTPAAAAIVVSILALFNTFGRILAGVLSDKIGWINTLTLVFIVAIPALALLCFTTPNTAVMFYIGICLVGVCFGSFMGVYPSFTAGKFGSKYSSVNYGIMFIGFSAAGIVGPMIMSNVMGATGTYQMAFLIAIVLALVGLLLSFVYRAMNKRENIKRMQEVLYELGEENTDL